MSGDDPFDEKLLGIYKRALWDVRYILPRHAIKQ